MYPYCAVYNKAGYDGTFRGLLLYEVYHSEIQQSYSPAGPGRKKGRLRTIEQVKQVSASAALGAFRCLPATATETLAAQLVSPFDTQRAHQRPDTDGCIWSTEKFHAIRIAEISAAMPQIAAAEGLRTAVRCSCCV